MSVASNQNLSTIALSKPIEVNATSSNTTTSDANECKLPLYLELMDLEEKGGIISSLEQFDCEICLSTIEIGDGVVIRNCLHQFCADCVKHTIIYSDDADIKCPQATDKCDNTLQDREIRALLSESEFDKYLTKTLRIAESQTKNAFHCKLANCEGWLICEDNLIEFTCPKCSSINCLTCRAIHTGQNCKEYQDDLNFGDLNENQRTEMCLDDMVKNNLGMRCPSCQIVILKREGCDFLTCKMCKTEICWATKGSRWGPNGHGDTSGGCKCMLNGIKCHPQCSNCH